MKNGNATMSFGALVQTLVALQQRQRLQRKLRSLNDDLLDDIGLCRADIEIMRLQAS